MIIAIGSTNIVKITALEELVPAYPELTGAEVISYSVSSEVAEQPLSLEEIIKGAKNRARNAFNACGSGKYGIGIESGLFKVNETVTGFLEACICCIYDGSHYSVGLSCGFEVPTKILKFVLEENMDLSQACYASGITKNGNIGSSDGLIGILSKGHINRKEYTKQAIVSALIQIQSSMWYK